MGFERTGTDKHGESFDEFRLIRGRGAGSIGKKKMPGFRSKKLNSNSVKLKKKTPSDHAN